MSVSRDHEPTTDIALKVNLVERLRAHTRFRYMPAAVRSALTEAADEIEVIDFERTALRAERDELVSVAWAAYAILAPGGLVPINGVTSDRLLAVLSKAEGK